MTDERYAWEEHSLDCEQLDLFAPEPDCPAPGAYNEPQAERVYQMTALPGETWQDAFGDAA